MHTGYWADALERMAHTILASGIPLAVVHALQGWDTDGWHLVDWRHYLLPVVFAAGSLLVSLVGSQTGDGSARLGDTHPVTPDGRGGRPMTHDEIDAAEAQS